MELTLEQQATNVRFYMRFLITGILKVICASNKQVILEAVLKIKKIKVGRYITSERNSVFDFRSSFCIFI